MTKMHIVKVDDDTYNYVTKQAKYQESFGKILRKLLKI
jgi:negative regulator of replication initiation